MAVHLGPPNLGLNQQNDVENDVQVLPIDNIGQKLFELGFFPGRIERCLASVRAEFIPSADTWETFEAHFQLINNQENNQDPNTVIENPATDLEEARLFVRQSLVNELEAAKLNRNSFYLASALTGTGAVVAYVGFKNDSISTVGVGLVGSLFFGYLAQKCFNRVIDAVCANTIVMTSPDI